MIITGKLACFIGGTLFGTAGVRILGSKDAKKLYTHVTAAALRCKDEVMRTADMIQENCSDILAEAKAINEERAEKEAEAVIEDKAEQSAENRAQA